MILADTATGNGTRTGIERADGGGDPRFTISFLLLENFSLISFASAIEPLRLANKVLKRRVFDYECYSPDGGDVSASNGTTMRVAGPLSRVARTDLLVICSSDNVEKVRLSPAVKTTIREILRSNCTVAGICTGAYVLAELGLLTDRACTIHWEYSEIFRELFPTANLQNTLVQEDGRFLTCAGGTSAFELMVGFIEEHCGLKIGLEVADIALHHSLRPKSGHQRAQLHLRLGITNKRLLHCVEMMEANIEQPIPFHDLVARSGVSRRQLERLFRQHFGVTPTTYYRTIRLNAARQLVQRTPMPIVDVAVASGFVNASHFTKCYRREFRINPAQDRIDARRDGERRQAPAPQAAE